MHERDDFSKQISQLKAEMKTRITALNEEIEAIPGAAELADYDLKIKQLTEKKEALGLFKGKEKKALQEQIDQTTIYCYIWVCKGVHFLCSPYRGVCII